MAGRDSVGGMCPVIPVLLCGGSGTRLWPLSRSLFPKQFQTVGGTETLLQATAGRLASVKGEAHPVGAPLVVTAEEHRFLVLEQLRRVGAEPAGILLEPEGRNTAAALTLAALAAATAGDPVLLVSPTDHLIADEESLRGALRRAIAEAERGALVVLGVPPQRPETGYGYIRAAAAPAGHPREVRQFVEKPDAGRAAGYLAAGDHFWNAGIFVVRASVWLDAVAAFAADIAQGTAAAWAQRAEDGIFIRPGRQAFLAVRRESVDYAVMERCPGSRFRTVMVELDAGWTDLGAWDSVWAALPKDDAGNACSGDVIAWGSTNSLAHASTRLVAMVGVQDVVVVETPDAVLVADRKRTQDVRSIVDHLERAGRSEHITPRKTYRPWGWYDVIDEADRFKVKHIRVEPGASLSLQFHRHRAEHWVVVRGTAEVTCGDQVQILSENQSTYIAAGRPHRLANPGQVPLEVIEVQSGDYLGEDDIVRLDDHYGRRAGREQQ